MQDLAHATAHLIHGSSEGRFTITYAPGHLTQAEIEGVNFRYADINDDDRPLPARRVQAGLEHDRRRRAVLLHPHAVGRPVGPSVAVEEITAKGRANSIEEQLKCYAEHSVGDRRKTPAESRMPSR